MFGWLRRDEQKKLVKRSAPKPFTLQLEELTSRDVPDAGGFAGVFFSLRPHVEVEVSVSNSAADRFSLKHGTVHSLPGSLNTSISNDDGATGGVIYSNDRSALFAFVRGAAANTTLAVLVDGMQVGTLSTNDHGRGKVLLKDLTTTVSAGSVITVGDLTGTFEQTRFKASLTGSTSGVSGNATYLSNWDTLGLTVKGLQNRATYNVLVDGTSIGTFKTFWGGRGVFAKHSDTLSISAGSTLTITDSNNATVLSGTFA